MYRSDQFKQVDEETFTLRIPADRDFRILQLTDLHLLNKLKFIVKILEAPPGLAGAELAVPVDLVRKVLCDV